MQAQAEHSNRAALANPCQASVVLQTHFSGPFSLLPILFNIDTTSETPSLNNSTVLRPRSVPVATTYAALRIDQSD